MEPKELNQLGWLETRDSCQDLMLTEARARELQAL